MALVFARRSFGRLAFAAALVSSSLVLGAVGCNGEDVGAAVQPLTAVCVEPNTTPPAGAWICGEDLVVECDTHQGAHVENIYASPATPSCPGSLDVSHPQPYFPPGQYEISVSAAGDGGPQQLCSSTLTVVDSKPPVITPKPVSLWSPNHKYHHVTPADCLNIDDACDAKVDVWFTWASSDEPANDLGDGNTEDDIANLSCDGVDLRAERQGTGDGRVYTLGWHAEDDAGNAIEGTCQVMVTHDKSGKPAIDSGEDHRVEIQDANEACDPTPGDGGQGGGGGAGGSGGGNGGGEVPA